MIKNDRHFERFSKISVDQFDQIRLQLILFAQGSDSLELIEMDFDFQADFEIVRLIGEIDEFKGAWRTMANLSPERLAILKRVATIESIGSSTRIEGARLTNQEVEGLLSGLRTDSFTSRDQEEVAGYSDLMELIFNDWREIPLTENDIKYLHKVLLQHTQKDSRHRGEYKVHANFVVAEDEHGHQSVIFETASPLKTRLLMPELVAWTRDELENKRIHSLLVVAVFVVRFLAIHPFKDGNGRLSRALTTLLLLKTGYEYVPYSSLESIIEKNKEAYYVALRKTQSSLDSESEKPNWEHWILFFLRSMKKQQEHLRSKLERERSLQGELPPLGIQILELIRQHGSLRSSQIADLTKESKSTIRLRLKELEDRGHIMHHGQGRSTRYTLKTINATVNQVMPMFTQDIRGSVYWPDKDS